MTQQELAKALTEAGHEPAKALEIAIDAKRGDSIARAWVRTLLGGPFRRVQIDD